MLPIHKALTFRASSIGDCLMGKYLLEQVHLQYPEAKCAIVVGSRGAMIRDLLRAYSWLEVREVHRLDFRGLWRLWRDFKKSDLVVTQYAGKPGGVFSFGSKLFARLLAKHGSLVGFVDASHVNGFLYDKLIPFLRDTAPAELERTALRVAGVTISQPVPMLTSQSQSLRDLPQLYVVAHLFAGNRGRGLHPENKRALLMALVKALPYAHIVLTGGKEDRAEALLCAKSLPVTVLAGETSLQQLISLMAKSIGVVSVDTGGAHIATQVGRPLVVLGTCLGLHWWGKEQYGAVAPVRLFTYPELKSHIYVDYPDCINKISVEDVTREAASFFANT